MSQPHGTPWPERGTKSHNARQSICLSCTVTLLAAAGERCPRCYGPLRVTEGAERTMLFHAERRDPRNERNGL